MQTVLTIKPSELNQHFLQAIKALFKNAAELEIIVNSPKTARAVFAPESREAYWKRIDKAIEDVENGRVVSMSMKELEKYVAKRVKK